MDEITLPRKYYRQGEYKKLRVRLWADTNVSLASATVTLQIWNSAGTEVVSTSMTLSGTTRAIASVLVDARTGGAINTVGDYDGLVTATHGGETFTRRVPITVKANKGSSA